jgi:hypothetical protein
MPHCGHHRHLAIDSSIGGQDYFEDCTACCTPIHINIHLDHANRKLEFHIDSDDEQVF